MTTRQAKAIFDDNKTIIVATIIATGMIISSAIALPRLFDLRYPPRAEIADAYLKREEYREDMAVIRENIEHRLERIEERQIELLKELRTMNGD